MLLLTFCGSANADEQDTRQKISMPEAVKTDMLSRMRDHLLALHEIQVAIAHGELDKASDIAETRIGVSSMQPQMQQGTAAYMPQAMRMMGMEMHKSASRFARTATEGDTIRALDSLSTVTEQCVACHAAYKLN
ncbi:hypothetical protein SFSGTM_04240 [Sulfuriferula nivalis]|uniref:Cytochrome C n=2 Tax=Sulfuriferula nivalis TaxID=2675298 RepID=A0A809RDJ5_9PROT|nr:hypothetical protein SFSGTM_04240 [Sulfuriferula nivalis]